eukprot:48437_1
MSDNNTRTRTFQLNDINGNTKYIGQEEAWKLLTNRPRVAAPPFTDQEIWKVVYPDWNCDVDNQFESDLKQFLVEYKLKDAWNNNIKDIFLKILPKCYLRYYNKNKNWFVWNGRKNEEMEEDDIKDLLKNALKTFFYFNAAVIEEDNYIDSTVREDVLQTLIKLAAHVQNESNITTIIKILRRQQGIRADSIKCFDRVKFAIICDNTGIAFIGLDQPVLFTPKPTDMFTHIFPVKFVENVMRNKYVDDLLSALADMDEDKLRTFVEFLAQSMLLVVKTTKKILILQNLGNLGKTELIRVMTTLCGDRRWSLFPKSWIMGAASTSKSDNPQTEMVIAMRWKSGGAFDEIASGKSDKQCSMEKTKDLIGAAPKPIRGGREKIETLSHNWTNFAFVNFNFKLMNNEIDKATVDRLLFITSKYTTAANPSKPFEIQRDPNLRKELCSDNALQYLFYNLVMAANNMSKRESFDPWIAPIIEKETHNILKKICPNGEAFQQETDNEDATNNIILSPKILAQEEIKHAATEEAQFTKMPTYDLLQYYAAQCLDNELKDFDERQEREIQKIREQYEMQVKKIRDKVRKRLKRGSGYSTSFGMHIRRHGAKGTGRNGVVKVPSIIASRIKDSGLVKEPARKKRRIMIKQEQSNNANVMATSNRYNNNTNNNNNNNEITNDNNIMVGTNDSNIMNVSNVNNNESNDNNIMFRANDNNIMVRTNDNNNDEIKTWGTFTVRKDVNWKMNVGAVFELLCMSKSEVRSTYNQYGSFNNHRQQFSSESDMTIDFISQMIECVDVQINEDDIHKINEVLIQQLWK